MFNLQSTQQLLWGPVIYAMLSLTALKMKDWSQAVDIMMFIKASTRLFFVAIFVNYSPVTQIIYQTFVGMRPIRLLWPKDLHINSSEVWHS